MREISAESIVETVARLCVEANRNLPQDVACALKGAEGFRKNNCFGTHLTGPILVKNPAMLKYIAKLLLGEAYSDTVPYTYMEKSYATTLSELRKRLELTKK